ncbi:MAG: hypothetical protein ACXABJ_02235, partial [Candidatus Heimdallarchaeaceae archaeon]
MNKEEIRKKVLSVLNESKTGILNPDLIKRLNIEKNTGEEYNYYKVIEKLVDEGRVLREKKAVKGKTLLYLPQYQDESLEHWGLLDKQIQQPQYVLDNIECGFLLINQEFMEKKSGSISQLEGYDDAKSLGKRGISEKFSGIEGKYDYLFFWVLNRNKIGVKDIDASIMIPPLFFKTLDSGKTHQCSYTVNNHIIRIRCDDLLGKAEPMPEDISYAMIPLERKELNDEYDKIEQIPIVKVK